MQKFSQEFLQKEEIVFLFYELQIDIIVCRLKYQSKTKRSNE